MEGNIGLNSKYGEGTTFWFTVPYKIEEKHQWAEKGLNEVPSKNKSFPRLKLNLNGTPNEKRIASFGPEDLNLEGYRNKTSFLDHINQQNLIEINEDDDMSRKLIGNIRFKDSFRPSPRVVANGHDSSLVSIPIRLKNKSKDAISSLKFDKIENSPNSNSEIDPLMLSAENKNVSNSDILIVDDSVFNLITLRALMSKSLKLNCDEAANGQIAIEMITKKEKSNRSYKIVLMDCTMPIIDGFEATRILRIMMKESKIRYFPIIALTALATSDDRKKCIEVGMNKHLSKPVLLKDLEEILKEYHIL